MTDTGKTIIRLWDLPVRLFHWATVLLVAAMWASIETGRTSLHITLGLVLLFVVAFRIAWGFVGGDTARFARFVKGPGAIRAYLRSGRGPDGAPVVGHNPLGALSVLALIGLLALQLGLGLFAADTDANASGPLNYLVSVDLGDTLTHLHGFVFNLILAMVAVHLAAIIYYAVKKKDRLVPAMVTGNKAYDVPVAQPKSAPLWRLVLALAAAGALTWWVYHGGHFVPPPPSLYDVNS